MKSTNSPSNNSSPSKEIRTSERGGVMVEMAASCGVFLFFLILMFDLARVGYSTAAIQYSLSKAAQEVSYAVAEDPNIDFVAKLNEVANRYGIEVNNAELRYCPLSQPDFSCAPNNSLGTSGGSFIAQVRKPIAVVGGLFDFTITRTVIATNEATVSS